MVVISQVGCDEIAPIILGYGNGARFRTLRSTITTTAYNCREFSSSP